MTNRVSFRYLVSLAALVTKQHCFSVVVEKSDRAGLVWLAIYPHQDGYEYLLLTNHEAKLRIESKLKKE